MKLVDALRLRRVRVAVRVALGRVVRAPLFFMPWQPHQDLSNQASQTQHIDFADIPQVRPFTYQRSRSDSPRETHS